ncbi:MAG: PstC family ABC transporter permease [Acholeplasmataceae bacterium]
MSSIKSSIRKRHEIINKTVTIVLLIATIISASMIILIIGEISGRGVRPFFHDYDGTTVNFFLFISGTSYYAPLYRIGFVIIDTLYVVFLSILLTTPIAVLTALFIVKMSYKWVGSILNTVVEVLAAIPSIIFGVFGSGYVVIGVKALASMFGVSTAGGLSTLSTVIVLTMMILPTVTMLSVTAIKSVPSNIEEGSLALGASETQTYFKISIQAAKPGIFAGIILGVGRALGEATAVSLVSGNAGSGPSFGLFDTTRTLTSTILIGIKETTGLDYDIRFSIGIVLIVVILITNFILNAVKKRMSRYYAT